MIKKKYNSWNNIHGACLEIARQMAQDEFYPDYIVGITRGGLVPAVLLSHYLNVPCETLKVSLRDGSECESNLWMAEDAFGHHAPPKKILIVDDINDSGSTFNWIKKDWQAGCFPEGARWSDVWHGNVKFAVITNNLSSTAEVDYFAYEVDKSEDNVWLVYPWENFWNSN